MKSSEAFRLLSEAAFELPVASASTLAYIARIPEPTMCRMDDIVSELVHVEDLAVGRDEDDVSEIRVLSYLFLSEVAKDKGD